MAENIQGNQGKGPGQATGQASGQASGGGSPISQPLERTKQTAERLRGEAVVKAEQVTEQASKTFEEGKHRLAERLRRFGGSMQAASEKLPAEDRAFAGYVGKARSRIEQAATYVEGASVDGAIRDVERFARREPALFFGSAFALGVAAARFLRSSRQPGGGNVEPEWRAVVRAPQEDLFLSGTGSEGRIP